MKKIKKIWQENSVLFVLLLILIACIIAISVVCITYFVGSSNSKYGDRLDGIDNYPFTEDTQKEIASKLEEDEAIEDVEIRVSGKTIYVTINFATKITLVEAESKALASLDNFSEDTLSFYDIEYLIKADSTEDTEGFQIIGSHNVSGTGGIVWNNNTEVSSEEE
jgi:hypothetical protein